MFPYLVWLRETDSTQRRLKEGNYPCGTVFVADRQKEGKGRKGRRWESQEGGLYFSFVLCEEDFRDYAQLPLIVGFSVSEYLDSLGIRTAIKWPNDVYSRGRKISGVLVEKSSNKIVVGIGLNVNQDSFPKELENSAISMKLASGKEYDRKRVLTSLLDFLSKNLNDYREKGFTAFKERIEDKLLFKEEEVVILGEEPVVGILVGIDDNGHLLLQTSEGLKSIAAGDLSLRLYR
ncbi:BirA family biotin operon repressor/biotin-[acetyl-CoA-carboxylase] ligase [Hydrogenivirga caldilitoris]|uniref:biotin--[biotin carboxyl-carrier protein] ligase n=1 Tax=Hydrogenivirga caldilitoris TaxID=246264 RepID=A0A497XSK1_9AQUI|nr:biotin--[acetyl-CoA-carboxylase] ligase [Hydrogenivirga caldilitoris]RLJ71231.1 BirA family biotin operon repressor/biotin-[acetyl-CoA-carboxylase] ligase [Hydrogenivirga caldilitoris]